MKPRLALTVTVALLAAAAAATPAAATGNTVAAVPIATEQAICDETFGDVYALPNPEPLAACQWDMALINADAATRARATGDGIRIGIIDSGVDIDHPDIAPNLDLATSCSFVRSDDPTIVAGLTDPIEAGNGDCANKAAVQDRSGHGTHVASIVASPVNGIGIAGVAPEATIVALKACTASTYCYGYAVADALRYAGDHDIDVVNMSLFADPYLYYCGNDAEQRALMRELQSAARYAQQHGVLLVGTAGNEQMDLRHPIDDVISPDGPDDIPIERSVGNNCRALPAELPGVADGHGHRPRRLPGLHDEHRRLLVGRRRHHCSGRRLLLGERLGAGRDPRGDAGRLRHLRRPRPAQPAVPGHHHRRGPGDVCLDQRHLDGRAACDRCRGADPAAQPAVGAVGGRGGAAAHRRRRCPARPTGRRSRPATSGCAATAAVATRRSSAPAWSTRTRRPGSETPPAHRHVLTWRWAAAR